MKFRSFCFFWGEKKAIKRLPSWIIFTASAASQLFIHTSMETARCSTSFERNWRFIASCPKDRARRVKPATSNWSTAIVNHLNFSKSFHCSFSSIWSKMCTITTTAVMSKAAFSSQTSSQSQYLKLHHRKKNSIEKRSQLQKQKNFCCETRRRCFQLAGGDLNVFHPWLPTPSVPSIKRWKAEQKVIETMQNAKAEGAEAAPSEMAPRCSPQSAVG